MERRRFLKSGGTLLAAGMVGLSGCGGVLGGGGGGGTTSFDDVTGWVPSPAVFDSNPYGFSARSPAGLAEASDLPSVRFNQGTGIGGGRSGFGTLAAEDVDYTVDVGLGQTGGLPEGRAFRVYVGSFDAEWTTTKLERTEVDGQPFDDDADIGEYDVYTANTRSVAVSDDVIIEARQTNPPEGEAPAPDEFVETIVDVDEGESDSYVTDEDMGELADSMPDGHVFRAETFEQIGSENANAETGNFENLVGRGTALTVQESQFEASLVLVFFAERAIDEPDIETYIEESPEFDSYQERPQYSVSGRTVEITGTTSSAQGI